jgi:hypothetical protein
MKRIAAALALACALTTALVAQNEMKPWTDWSKKDAEKILNDSPWGQTQTQTDTSEMFYTPTEPGARNARRDAEGNTNQAINIKYRIRFLSARPIRQAFARVQLLDAQSPNKAMVEGLKNFADAPPNPDSIIVAVTYESKDGRVSGRAFQAFSTATAETIRNKTYLQRKDGQRLFLTEYQRPDQNPLRAAFFAFPRVVDGKPFITPETGEVRFVASLGQGVELNMRFDVSKMNYGGALEY